MFWLLFWPLRQITICIISRALPYHITQHPWKRGSFTLGEGFLFWIFLSRLGRANNEFPREDPSVRDGCRVVAKGTEERNGGKTASFTIRLSDTRTRGFIDTAFERCGRRWVCRQFRSKNTPLCFGRLFDTRRWISGDSKLNPMVVSIRRCRYVHLASEHSGRECVVGGIKYKNAVKLQQ